MTKYSALPKTQAIRWTLNKFKVQSVKLKVLESLRDNFIKNILPVAKFHNFELCTLNFKLNKKPIQPQSPSPLAGEGRGEGE